MKYEIEKLPQNTYHIKISVNPEELRVLRDQIIESLVKETEIPGFRKGMAPRSIVEKNIDERKIKDEIINHSINSYYSQAIKESHLKPIIFPRIEIIEFELEKGLTFLAKICEIPQITIGDYRDAIRKLQIEQKNKEILGTDGKPITKNGDSDIDKVLEALASVSNVDLSDLLIEEEVNHMLSRLIDQTSRLGLTIEQYLQSSGKEVDKLREEYKIAASKTLKTEFLLYEIAKQENIGITDKEISDTINLAKDEKSKVELYKEENRDYLKSVLLKNKVIQYLVNLK